MRDGDETYVRFCPIPIVIDISNNNNNTYKVEKVIIDDIIRNLNEFVEKLNKPERKGMFCIFISCKLELENVQDYVFTIYYNNVLNTWNYSINSDSVEIIKEITKIIDEHKIQYTPLNKTNTLIWGNWNEYFDNEDGVIILQENKIRELWKRIITILY